MTHITSFVRITEAGYQLVNWFKTPEGEKQSQVKTIKPARVVVDAIAKSMYGETYTDQSGNLLNIQN